MNLPPPGSLLVGLCLSLSPERQKRPEALHLQGLHRGRRSLRFPRFEPPLQLPQNTGLEALCLASRICTSALRRKSNRGHMFQPRSSRRASLCLIKGLEPRARPSLRGTSCRGEALASPPRGPGSAARAARTRWPFKGASFLRPRPLPSRR